MVTGEEQHEIQADRVLKDMEKAGHDEPMEIDPHPDRTRESRAPNFFRMRVNERVGESNQVVQALTGTLRRRLMQDYPDAFELMNEVYAVVREAVVDDQGEIATDAYGFPVWERTSTGNYVEDWSRLTIRAREHFLFSITTRLFEWRLRKAEAWSASMFLKGQWEVTFAWGFDEPEGKLTVDDRTQKATLASRQERFEALFAAAYSQHVDALIRSMEEIELRLSQSVD